MHLIVPFAAPLTGHDTAGVPPHLDLPDLPHLQRLLAGRAPAWRDDGDALSLSPPHERARARVQGWSGGDGLLPWAADQARNDGLQPGDQAWGLMSPAHLHVGTEQVSLVDPQALALTPESSRELLDIVRPLFESEGFVVAWGAPTRWYLAHECLRELATASLDRVIGRNIDPWLPPLRTARLVKRLQNEVQMLLYTHPVNDAREAAGLPVVNSFWLSGCGPAQAVRGDAQVDDRLRAPALAGNVPGWRAAWQALDEQVFAAWVQGPESHTLTLCGERSALTYEIVPRTTWQALRARLTRPDLRALLEAL